MHVITEARVPIKSWAPIESIEQSAIQQLINTANLPCIFKHMAAMPDVHYGIGATVGSVVPTVRAVIPACVGVDIGCGMIAAKLPFTASDLPDSLSALRSEIEWRIPVGEKSHTTPLPESLATDHSDFFNLPLKIQEAAKDRYIRQLGTLGQGNHFIEVCLDTEQQVWVMLHSGSRGVGNMIGKHYIDVAKKMAEAYFIELADQNLAYLVEGTKDFEAYWRDLQWAQAYAMENRQLMMMLVLRSVASILLGDWRAEITPLLQVNCHHNYAEREHHFGQNVIVTRKGAVRAREGDMGIIPGSMGARSFIVRGKGNEQAFHSCSHGAGRTMSRSEARRRFTVEDLAAQTQGIECKKDSSVLDEIPGSYKDIDTVMQNQADLVEIVAELKQVLCVKG